MLVPTCKAQDSWEIAPYSFKAWGMTTHSIMLTTNFGRIGGHYFFAMSREGIEYKGDPAEFTDSFAISYAIFDVDWAKVSVMGSHRPIPIRSASRVNFKVDLGIPFNTWGIYYTHISNGFGLLNGINPGVDFVSLRFFL